MQFAMAQPTVVDLGASTFGTTYADTTTRCPGAGIRMQPDRGDPALDALAHGAPQRHPPRRLVPGVRDLALPGGPGRQRRAAAEPDPSSSRPRTASSTPSTRPSRRRRTTSSGRSCRPGCSRTSSRTIRPRAASCSTARPSRRMSSGSVTSPAGNTTATWHAGMAHDAGRRVRRRRARVLRARRDRSAERDPLQRRDEQLSRRADAVPQPARTFQWQIASMNPPGGPYTQAELFGTTSATPTITTVFAIPPGGTSPAEIGVAILPGGSNGSPYPGVCPRDLVAFPGSYNPGRDLRQHRPAPSSLSPADVRAWAKFCQGPGERRPGPFGHDRADRHRRHPRRLRAVR